MAKLKRSLSDLADYMFEELDRLSRDDMEPDELKAEVDRAKALCAISDSVVGSASVQLKALVFAAEQGMLPAGAKCLPDTILLLETQDK